MSHFRINERKPTVREIVTLSFTFLYTIGEFLSD